MPFCAFLFSPSGKQTLILDSTVGEFAQYTCMIDRGQYCKFVVNVVAPLLGSDRLMLSHEHRHATAKN